MSRSTLTATPSRRAASIKADTKMISPHELQAEFFRQMGGRQQFQFLFEDLPGVSFFVKDRQSRMICASRAFCAHLGAQSEAELIGKTDYDFFPPYAADHFVRDDQQVIQTGQPMIGRVELWYNEQQILDWFVTNKLPVRSTTGEVIGVMGAVRSYEGQRRAMQPMSQIDSTVNYIRQHHTERITVDELAERACLSPRQLHRKFREVFGLSVQDFLIKTRIQAASDALLQSDQNIAQIAARFGFCDQSAFTQLFRKHTGMTPLKFRRRYMTASDAK